MNPVNIHSTSWKNRYEALRRYVLDAHGVLETNPLGLILLIRQGVAGWMRSWVSSTGCSEATVPSPDLECPPTSLRQQQLTVLLAQMTIPHLSSTLKL